MKRYDALEGHHEYHSEKELQSGGGTRLGADAGASPIRVYYAAEDGGHETRGEPRRILAMLIYLNDVSEGGETAFLAQVWH